MKVKVTGVLMTTSPTECHSVYTNTDASNICPIHLGCGKDPLLFTCVCQDLTLDTPRLVAKLMRFLFSVFALHN